MNIAVFGYGTVGSGVVDLVSKCKADIHVTKIFGRENKRSIIGDRVEGSVDAIMNDKSIDIVVETLGGKDLAYEVITKALKNKKHVITANKEIYTKTRL